MEPINSAKVKKTKSKKNKTTDNHDKQNINMKKSFSKFNDMQKRSLIHVRSRDSNKAKEIFCTPMAKQQLDNCHQCQKSVYKMEEVVLQLKTGTKMFHKTCLRCKECSKQLKLDSYYAHEGYLYCHMHFKLIFAPKIVYEGIKPQKPELIIRENQPMELPPDVARASDKPNLGLDELQQLNVRSRFEVFENACSQNSNNSQNNYQGTAITHGKSIRSTLTKLHKLGISNLKSEEFKDINDIVNLDDDSNGVNNDSDYYPQVLTEKERPLGLGEAINDIRTKFENGEMITKEERREERKQEIQGIRSRLFMGKQAKIKEMYQQAVAESEQGLTSVGKTTDIELITDMQSIKDRFENGEAFKDTIKIQSKEAIEDAEVFESAISKASRNIFMQLDANRASDLDSSRSTMSSNPTEKLIQSDKKIVDMDLDIIKSDTKPEYVKVATEELTEKFKFFEQFRPVEKKRHIFRITPPREGVVRMDSDTDTDILSPTEQTSNAEYILMKTKTSTILNKFREMEKNKILDKNNQMKQPKPLKCFTPPPETEIDKHFSNNKSDSEDEESFSEDDETNTNEGDDDKEIYSENVKKSCNRDQALQEAKNAARAKQLCAKFEKWQIDEIKRELKEDREDVYSQLISSDSIESAKIIRERFENMKTKGETQMENNVPRAKINRFVMSQELKSALYDPRSWKRKILPEA